MALSDIKIKFEAEPKPAFPMLIPTTYSERYRKLHEKVALLEQVSGHPIDVLIDLFARGYDFDLRLGDYR